MQRGRFRRAALCGPMAMPFGTSAPCLNHGFSRPFPNPDQGGEHTDWPPSTVRFRNQVDHRRCYAQGPPPFLFCSIEDLSDSHPQRFRKFCDRFRRNGIQTDTGGFRETARRALCILGCDLRKRVSGILKSPWGGRLTAEAKPDVTPSLQVTIHNALRRSISSQAAAYRGMIEAWQ